MTGTMTDMAGTSNVQIQSQRLVDWIQSEEFKYSFEVTPELKLEDIDTLELAPTFFAVTWHAKSHQCKDLNIEPLKIASYLRSKQKNVVIHLSCDLLRKPYLESLLAFLQEKEICNLFLVLGESFQPDSSDFKSTMELIKYIREISGTYFCIGVAGFCDSNEERLAQLKEKIDAGANFIITQAFFDGKAYKVYVEQCNKIGINVPIIPGVFAFQNYKQLINFTNMCRVKISDDLLEFVKKNERNDIAGVEVLKNLVNCIRADYTGVNFHFFTLNKIQNVCDVIKKIQN